jgi:hypothetical protein
MFNLLQVLDLAPGASADDAERLAGRLGEAGGKFDGVVNSAAGSTLPRDIGGGGLMWRLVFASEDDYWAASASQAWREYIAAPVEEERAEVLDSIAYRPTLSDASAGRPAPGIWRCLVLSVDAGTPAETIARFERDTVLMPRHVSTIRNWSMGQVVARQGRRNWTHVWEQEFDDTAGLEGEYMTHPIHWGLVDGWFDPECPQRIVDPFLIHAAFEIGDAVIV